MFMTNKNIKQFDKVQHLAITWSLGVPFIASRNYVNIYSDILPLSERFAISSINQKNKIFERMKRINTHDWEVLLIAKGALLLKRDANLILNGEVTNNEDIFKQNPYFIRKFIKEQRIINIKMTPSRGREEEISKQAIIAYLKLNKKKRRSHIRDRTDDCLFNQAILGAFSFTKDMAMKIGSKRRQKNTKHCCNERDTREHIIFNCKKLKNLRPTYLKEIARTRKRNRGANLIDLGKREKLISFLRKARKLSVIINRVNDGACE
jgi:hypothetical protein